MSTPLSELTDLQFIQLQAIAATFGIECIAARITGGGFSNAAVFKVSTGDDRHFAIRRISTDSNLDMRYLQILHVLQAFLVDHGMLQIASLLSVVAKNETAAAASLLTDTLLVRHDGVWQAEQWMPGTPLSGPQLSTLQIENAATALHQFHSLAAEFAARGASTNRFELRIGPSPALTRRLQIIKELLDGELEYLDRTCRTDTHSGFRQPAIAMCNLLRASLPELQQESVLLQKERFLLQPVIRDLWSEHVLFTEDQVTGIIDLNASATDHVSLDLARLQRSWFANDTQRITEFVAAYQCLRPFSPTERQLFTTFDACNVLLSPVTWLRRRYLQGELDLKLTPHILQRFVSLAETADSFRRLPM